MVFAEGAGQYRFRIYLPRASRVEVVGAFTAWRASPVPMLAQDHGWWQASLNIEPGDYEFCYLVDGSVWLADYAASGVRVSGHGHWVSTLRCTACDGPGHQRAVGGLIAPSPSILIERGIAAA